MLYLYGVLKSLCNGYKLIGQFTNLLALMHASLITINVTKVQEAIRISANSAYHYNSIPNNLAGDEDDKELVHS